MAEGNHPNDLQQHNVTPLSEQSKASDTYFVNVGEKKTVKSRLSGAFRTVFRAIGHGIKRFFQALGRGIKYLFSGHIKYITILVLVVTAVVAGVIIFNLIKSQQDARQQSAADAEQDRIATIVNNIYKQDSVEAAISYIDEQISQASSQDELYRLQVGKCTYYAWSSLPANSIECFDAIDRNGLTEEQLFQLYYAYLYPYSLQGNQDKMAEYQQQAYDLVPGLEEADAEVDEIQNSLAPAEVVTNRETEASDDAEKGADDAASE